MCQPYFRLDVEHEIVNICLIFFFENEMLILLIQLCFKILGMEVPVNGF